MENLYNTKDLRKISSDKKQKLQYGLTASEVFDFVKSLDIPPSDNLSLAHYSTVSVGVAQVNFREYHSLFDYIREMNMLVTSAANNRAHIVCFPAFFGFLPASIFPQYRRIVDDLRINPQNGKPDDMWLYQAFTGLTSEAFEVYFSTMSALAAAHKIYISAGSTIFKESSKYIHRALLFAPDGKLSGYQDKFSLSEIDAQLQVEAASKLNVFETEIGKIAIIINDDINYLVLTRIAHELGAKIIINPSCFTAPYTNTSVALGLNLSVLSYPVFGVQSVMQGKLPIEIELQGESGVFGPSTFSSYSAKNARFETSVRKSQSHIFTVPIEVDKLDKISQLNNPAFIEKNFDYLY